MGTIVRPEITEKSKYWISRHHYYELKHFCLQYPEWKRAYNDLDLVPSVQYSDVSSKSLSDPTSKLALRKIDLSKKMDLVTKIAFDTDLELSVFLFKAVTEGYSYDNLKAKMGIPCEKDMYYDRYRKFFWLLSLER